MDTITRAIADYTAARTQAQQQADVDPVRQADVAAGLIERPHIAEWDELPPEVRALWLAETRRKMEAGQ